MAISSTKQAEVVTLSRKEEHTGLPCSHLSATVSEDLTALDNLQAGPQTPGQSTGVADARYGLTPTPA
ncbi:UNVERIFIED_CONTAM: hypothetical protein FKN15_073445 [Acipenser sinensis]